ncbi:Uma2 family endonuclease [Thiofilum flexile]|uniref:Uma2 family endonuclease n=1 Tax=Thiofilum flexile TaxID=125627 RepID=UPI000365C075|nr:Uma2 family endonuclease [Thiofilum flexile]
MPLAYDLPPISEDDYLARELGANERHEYVAGQVYLMAGSSKNHNRIALNIASYFNQLTRGSSCQVYASDMKVRIKERNSYYYPDVVVSCDNNDNNDYFLDYPCLIIEVTSDSTLRKDYLEKSLAYQSISSLQTYIIVAQDKYQVDILRRNAKGYWDLSQMTGLEQSIELPCPISHLSLQEIYQDISFNT